MTDVREKLVIPEYMAVIMDGNGRWAKKWGVPRAMGHKAGYETLERTIRAVSDMGTQYFMIYGLSTGNWKCLAEEVGALMRLTRYYLVRLLRIASQNDVKAEISDEKSRFGKDIIKGIDSLVEGAEDNTRMQFTIAVNYDGRDEIVRAAKKLVKEYRDSGRNVSEIDETVFDSHLDTHDLSNPDLLIRTSGEVWLSNYLLRQLAYTELYMADCL